MSYIFELFIYLDLFGTKPRFLIDGYKSQRSYIGAFISIICCSCVFMFFIYFFEKILSHSKPNMVVSNLIDDLPDKYYFTDDFVFAISLQFPNYTNYVNESIYFLKLYDVEYQFLEDNSYIFKEKEIPISLCSNYNIKVLPEYFGGLNLKQLYCANFSGYYLEGEYGQKKWRTLNFKFSKCRNFSNYNNCLNQEEIGKYLQSGYVDIFMTDKMIVPKDFKNPTKIYGKNIFDSINGKEYMDYWIYLKRLEVQTDEGIVFDQIVKKSVLSFEKTSKMKYSLLDETFLQVILRISINKDIYDRTYMKLQEALANVGGMVKIIFTIGEILNYLTKIILYRNYILQFFNMDYFKAITNNKKNIKHNKSVTIPPLIITNKNLLNLNTENNIELRDYIQINNSNINLQFHNNSSFIKNQSLQELLSIKNKNGIKKILNNNISKNENKNKNNQTIFYTDYNFKVNKNYLYNKVIRRKIRKYHSILDILLKKGCCKQIISSIKRFRKISFLFEISRYIKNINETNLLKNLIFDEKQKKLLSYIYHFDYVFEKEKIIYDQIADYKPNS
jgi:hypothetical protein